MDATILSPRQHDAPSATLILTAADIARVMSLGDYFEAAHAAFSALAEDAVVAPAPLHLAADTGALHAKGALLAREGLACVKINANFPGNPARGLPTIQGVLALFDARNGSLLALLDSAEITLRRTAAATALAARHGARPDASAVTICGCGGQARAQIDALRDIFPLRLVYAWDRDIARAQALAAALNDAGLRTIPVGECRYGAIRSDIVIACTTARAPYLGVEDVQPGVFIAAIGADSAGKSEIAPLLMAKARIVTDLTSQCAVMGDLRVALETGAVARGGVDAELGEVVLGLKPARLTEDDIVIFDSTGVGAQDVFAAAAAFERARATGRGAQIVLAA